LRAKFLKSLTAWCLLLAAAPWLFAFDSQFAAVHAQRREYAVRKHWEGKTNMWHFSPLFINIFF
jgi:hypothetical protein